MTIKKAVTKLLAVGLIAAAGTTFAACGTSATQHSKASTKSACNARRKLKLNREGAVSSGGCELDTTIEVDATAFGKGKVIADTVANAVLEAASATIDHGGVLNVSLVGANAYRTVDVYEGPIAPAAGLDRLERQEQQASIRSGLQSVVEASFDPHASRTTKLREALKQLSGPGSDLGRSLGVAMHRADAGDGFLSAALLISDGVIDTPDLHMELGLSRPRLAAQIAALAREAGAAHVDMVAVLGVGDVPDRYSGRRSSATTARLVAIWTAACEQLNVGNCVIEPEL